MATLTKKKKTYPIIPMESTRLRVTYFNRLGRY